MYGFNIILKINSDDFAKQEKHTVFITELFVVECKATTHCPLEIYVLLSA
jgi:hypothetical protein